MNPCICGSADTPLAFSCLARVLAVIHPEHRCSPLHSAISRCTIYSRCPKCLRRDPTTAVPDLVPERALKAGKAGVAVSR